MNNNIKVKTTPPAGAVCPPAKKLMKTTEQQQQQQPKSYVSLSLVDLPEILRERIMSYLLFRYHTSSALLALSATCRSLLHDVENISKNSIQNIASNNHNIDDDWLTRVGLLKKGESNNNNETKEESSSPLSSNLRTMLQTAFQTPIYSLSTNRGVLSLALHSDKKQLLSGGFGLRCESSNLCLWDLSTKQCIKSFKGHNGHANFCFFAANDGIVSYSNDESTTRWRDERLRIWNIDGTCREACHVGDDGSNLIVINDREIFVTDATLPGSVMAIRKVDIKTGKTTLIIESNIPAYPRLFPLKGNYFIVFSKRGIGEGDILVFDSKTFEEVSRITGPYVGLMSNQNGEVVACTRFGRYDFFYQTKNILTLRKSLVVNNKSEYDNKIYLLHKSRMYVDTPNQESSIDVYNVEIGKIERRLCYPHEVDGISYHPECMVATEKVLLVGFNLGYGHDRAGNTIKAYAL